MFKINYSQLLLNFPMCFSINMRDQNPLTYKTTVNAIVVYLCSFKDVVINIVLVSSIYKTPERNYLFQQFWSG
jgi:hypothetical protein